MISLEDGNIVESSRQRRLELFRFVLGSSAFFGGLNRAVRTFGRGERSKVKIASEYGMFKSGYDIHTANRTLVLTPIPFSNSNRTVPPNSILICDIELVDFNERHQLCQKPFMCNLP